MHRCVKNCAEDFPLAMEPSGDGDNLPFVYLTAGSIFKSLVWQIASLPWVYFSRPLFLWLIASSSVPDRLFASFAMPTNMVECSHPAGSDAPHSFRNADKRARMRSPCLQTYVNASIKIRTKFPSQKTMGLPNRTRGLPACIQNV